MALTFSIMNQGRKIWYISKKRRCTTVDSHINSSISNNFNTSNSDNFIVNSNVPFINVQTESSFNILIILKKRTDIESLISINDEIIDNNNISE